MVRYHKYVRSALLGGTSQECVNVIFRGRLCACAHTAAGRACISRAFTAYARARIRPLARAIGYWPIRPAPCFVPRFGLIWGCRQVLSYFRERLSTQLVTVARSVPIANLCPSSHSADGALDFKFVALVPIGLLADVQNGTIFDELLIDALSKKVYMIFGACPHQMG